ncbi:MAG: S8 family serine peptidase [Chloroflexota bacterium]
MGPLSGGSGERGGYSPVDLPEAYDLPSEGGAGLTIATTVAFDYPNAESDLAAYRETYGLPPCTSEDGCFRKVNQDGEEGSYPKADSGWAGEAALDLDMASAICPECKLLLVEADDEKFDSLPLAVNTAVKLGADVVNDSWGAEEFSGETSVDVNFDHPGVPIVFSSGDSGYGVSYPAASPNVIAVGGTSLRKHESARGWIEQAWSGAGSGCSEYEAKPHWQNDPGCTMRTDVDVAAVADPKTSVSVYDTFGFSGWQLFGGTSVAAPIVAGVEALSSAAERDSGAALFWKEGPEGKLFDIGEGRNGGCPFDAAYLCIARLGYDGPTGWGTPGASRPGPPVAATYYATDIGATDVTLHGAINPNGGETSYRFEYDTTSYFGPTRHGKSVPIPIGEIGKGNEPIELSKRVVGLSDHLTYYYRIVALGALGTTYGGQATFHTSGWSPQQMPHSEEHEKMLGVSCASTSFCASVGVEDVYYDPPSTSYSEQPFAERWDGEKWIKETVPVPHPPAAEHSSRLEDVSCSSPDACMAVGTNYEFDESNKRRQPFAERWDGNEWSLVPMPLPEEAAEKSNGFREARMRGISCVSAPACVAVGEFTKEWNGSAAEEIDTLVESWNGVDWTVQASPNPVGEKHSTLLGISCQSEESCSAVGESRDAESKQSMLFERWNGVGWSLETGPDLVGGLWDVSCASSEECVAVGGVDLGAGRAAVWNGSAWVDRSPERALQGVSCWAVGQCVAVGADPWTKEGYAYRWKQGKWKLEDPPAVPEDASSPGLGLNDVSCLVTGTACTAVGWYWTGVFQPLADRLNLIAPPTVSNDPVGEVTATTAVLNGHVDNNGAPAGSSCHFEIAPKLAPTYPVGSVACEPGTIDGDLSTAVSAKFSGLNPDSEYVYRVLAESEGGTGKGLPYGEFRTLPAPTSPEEAEEPPAAPAGSCATDPTLCPSQPTQEPRRDPYATCVAHARTAFRKARRAARHKQGRARARALKKAGRRKRRAVARCKQRLRRPPGGG